MKLLRAIQSIAIVASILAYSATALGVEVWDIDGVLLNLPAHDYFWTSRDANPRRKIRVDTAQEFHEIFDSIGVPGSKYEFFEFIFDHKRPTFTYRVQQALATDSVASAEDIHSGFKLLRDKGLIRHIPELKNIICIFTSEPTSITRYVDSEFVLKLQGNSHHRVLKGLSLEAIATALQGSLTASLVSESFVDSKTLLVISQPQADFMRLAAPLANVKNAIILRRKSKSHIGY